MYRQTTIRNDKLTVSIAAGTLSIGYWERPGRGPAIVFLHGLGCSRDDFLPATTHPALRGRALLSLDFPGSGDSPYPSSRALAADDLADLTMAVVRKLCDGPVVLVGHSSGGLVGLLVAEGAPELVHRFISVEGNLTLEDCLFTARVAAVKLSTFRRRTLPGLRKRLGTSTNRGIARYARCLASLPSQRAYYDYSHSIVAHCTDGGLLERYGRLPVPRLYVHGDANRGSPHLTRVRRASTRLVEIRNADHFPFIDQPALFYTAIASFVDAEEVPEGHISNPGPT